MGQSQVDLDMMELLSHCLPFSCVLNTFLIVDGGS